MMTKEKIKLLGKCLAYWQSYVDNTALERFKQADRPLCQEFLHSESPCKGCPIQEYTGHSHCVATPYWRYRKIGPGYGASFMVAFVRLVIEHQTIRLRPQPTPKSIPCSHCGGTGMEPPEEEKEGNENTKARL